jgi:serine/threonine protein kinase
MEEIRIHQILTECPSIIRLYRIYECDENLYLLLEYQKGGTLSERVRNGILFSEDEARIIATQLLLAADFMSEKNVIHRDLKPDNVLFNSKDSQINDVRIADLGFAI